MPPVEVRPDARVVIGRSRASDLPVSGENVSRCHCEVWKTGDTFSVRDLESTNGTFVSGERIEGEQALHPGDRIEVGSCAITFCLVEGSVDAFVSAPDNHATVCFERSALREAFSGDLAEIPVFAVLQILELGQQSGRLEVAGRDGLAQLWLAAGHPQDAEVDGERGLGAALRLAGYTHGKFRFEAGEDPPTRSIHASMTELLLEGARRLDEGSL